MVTFDPNKKKNLSFSISVQGIDPSILEYNLRLSNGSVDYGFKGKNNNGEVMFSIPPLQEVINKDVLHNLNEIKLEVNDKNNKYYLKPFENEIKIKKEMKVETKLEKEKEKETETNEFSVDVSLNEDDNKEAERKKPNTKLKE
jgi:hypothetical protein